MTKMVNGNGVMNDQFICENNYREDINWQM